MMTNEAIAVGIGLVACVTDLRSRRIPNLLTFGSAAAAVVFAAATHGWSGAAMACAGCVVGLALFLPLFLLGGMGAGDVKLLGALGAWLGVASIVWVALYGAIAGGVLAIVVALLHGYARTLFRNVGLLLTHWRVNGLRSLEALTLEGGGSPRIAYALPIAVGVLCRQWLR
jgi:prepilin peptidase CpaA